MLLKLSLATAFRDTDKESKHILKKERLLLLTACSLYPPPFCIKVNCWVRCEERTKIKYLHFTTKQLLLEAIYSTFFDISNYAFYPQHVYYYYYYYYYYNEPLSFPLTTVTDCF